MVAQWETRGLTRLQYSAKMEAGLVDGYSQLRHLETKVRSVNAFQARCISTVGCLDSVAISELSIMN